MPLPRASSSATYRFIALMSLLGLLLIGLTMTGANRQELIRIGSAGGPAAPVVAVAGSALLAAAIVPRTLLALVGGVVFGWAAGTGYMLLGVTAGSVMAFAIGRYLGRPFVSSRRSEWLNRIETTVRGNGLTVVIAARMIPVVPFGVSNYLFGATAIHPLRFLIGTAVGAAPGTAAYAALGSATAHGNMTGATVAGSAATALTVAGYACAYLVWRRRPRTAGSPPRG